MIDSLMWKTAGVFRNNSGVFVVERHRLSGEYRGKTMRHPGDIDNDA